LDHNATTPVLPEVFEAMRPWLTSEWGNPSSAHVYGRRARAAVEEARRQVAALIGARSDEIIFTSCGSESDNLAIFGASQAIGERGALLTSRMEHPAVEEAVALVLHRQPGWIKYELSTGVDGRVRLDDLPKAPIDLVSVMLAHNETGAIQAIAQLVHRVRRSNPSAVVHTDAAQAVGKIAVDVDELGVDLLTIVGHKFGAPKGVAALYRRSGVSLESQQRGGGQEMGMRAGTEAVAQVVALGEASRLASARGEPSRAQMEGKRERLWSLLESRVEGLHRTLPGDHCLPNTLHVCVPGRDGRELLAALPELAASTGSACHASSDDVPGVLGEMGLDAKRARGALRLSLGFDTRYEDLERAAELLAVACR
jgi:cysteine desulfurase